MNLLIFLKQNYDQKIKTFFTVSINDNVKICQTILKSNLLIEQSRK